MSVVTLGCDPDAKAHGIAVYIDGGLCHLKSMNTIELYEYVKELPNTVKITSISAHIENVKARRSAWHGGGVGGAIDVGKCHQAQTELELIFNTLKIDIVLHKISKEWKSQAGKKQFELVTKWKGSSNKDNRSGAYFGYLGCK